MSFPAGGMDGQPRRAHLYVGNLSPRVTEYMLTEIFAVAGPVQHVKIIPDRNFQHGGLNYGFVEYMDLRAAETALQTLNGRKIFDTEIRVNWAYQGVQNKEDTTGHYHVFVGDLSPEVNDDVLSKAFAAFGTLSDARVMWDMNSGKSRGYGFLAFRDKTDAEQAIATMNGEWLGSRAIRVNWANQKTMGGLPGAPGPAPSGGGGMGGGFGSMGGAMRMPAAPAPTMMAGAVGGAPAPAAAYAPPAPTGPLTYEQVAAQTPSFNSTVYVGNLVPYTTQADLIPLFQGIGYISEIRMQADRGFAFVKLDTHEHASLAIVQLQGQLVHGRPIKCSWGKDRSAGDAMSPTSPGASASPYGAAGMSPMYSMPQAGQYAQYPGYGAWPASGAPGGAAGGAGTPGADPAAAAQWGAQDPNAFYQQAGYWGGYYGQQPAGGAPGADGSGQPQA